MNSLSFLQRSRLLKRILAFQALINTMGSNIIITGLASVTSILIARLLGPAGRGELATAMAWGAVLSVLIQIGIQQAITYTVSNRPEKVSRVFGAMLNLWLIQSVIALIVGPLLAYLVYRDSRPTTIPIIVIFLLSVPATQLVFSLSAIAQGLKSFAWFNGLRVAQAAAQFLILLVAMLLGIRDLLTITILLTLSSVILAVVAFILYLRQVRPEWERLAEERMLLLRYGAKSYFGNISWLINVRFDQFVMSLLFVSLDQLGLYAVAVTYSRLLFPLSSAVAFNLFPRLARVNPKDQYRRIVRFNLLNIVLSGGGSLLIVILSPFLIPLLFGSAFAGAANVAIILVIGNFFLGMNYVLSDGLRGLNRPGVPSIAEGLGTGFTFVGLIVLVPRFGIMGAAVLSLTVYGLITVILLYFTYDAIRLRKESALEQLDEASV